MITITTVKPPDYTPEEIDKLLAQSGPIVVSDLRLIDAIITRAQNRRLAVQFKNAERKLNLRVAYTLRYQLGLDIR